MTHFHLFFASTILSSLQYSFRTLFLNTSFGRPSVALLAHYPTNQVFVRTMKHYAISIYYAATFETGRERSAISEAQMPTISKEPGCCRVDDGKLLVFAQVL